MLPSDPVPFIHRILRGRYRVQLRVSANILGRALCSQCIIIVDRDNARSVYADVVWVLPRNCKTPFSLW
jgi:hypothetical protein